MIRFRVERGAASKGGCSHDWLPHIAAPKTDKHPTKSRWRTWMNDMLFKENDAKATMEPSRSILTVAAMALAASLLAQGPRGGAPRPAARSLPDGPEKQVVQRVCGSTCHGAEIVAGKGYSRDNWTT